MARNGVKTSVSPRCVARLVTATAVAALLPGVARSASTPGAHLVKGPYLTGVSDTGIEVRFELDVPGRGTVEVTPEPPVVREGGVDGAARNVRDASTSASVTASDGKTDTFHVVTVSGLAPATRYAYIVRGGGVTLGAGRFATGPATNAAGAGPGETGEASLHFLVYGDDRTDPSAHQLVVRAMSTTPSDLLVNTGDLVEDGASAADWQSFFDAEASLLRERALFVAIGNHELYDDAAGSNFARFFGAAGGAGGGTARPYGSTRLADVRFFFLNGMDDWDSGEERQWLEHELTTTDGERGVSWRIAVVHQGPWSAGPHGGNGKLLDAHVPELLAAHHVDLVLSGHDHIYERGDGGLLKYIISGGGGAPLYRVGEPTPTTRKAEAAYHFVEVTAATDALRIVAHRIDGSIIEACGLLKKRPWDCDPFPWGRSAQGASASSPATSGGGSPAPQAGPSPPGGGGTPSSSSRCGCDVPGARRLDPYAASTGTLGALVLTVALRVLRRLRRC
jgi:hypothetical protein